jgi:ribosomal protein S18 acetylase RimI-like enzyme
MRADIRRARSSDVEAIVAFGSEVIPPHYAPILGSAAARDQLVWWTVERVTSAVEVGRVHVAVVDKAVVGVIEIGEVGGEHVIWKLYLAPQFRGCSIGVDLLHEAIASLPAEAEALLVEHFAGNARARSFYEREGFSVVRTEPSTTGHANAAVVWRRLELRGENRVH